MRGWFITVLVFWSLKASALELSVSASPPAPLGQWQEVTVQASFGPEASQLELEELEPSALYLEASPPQLSHRGQKWQQTWTWRALASEAGSFEVGPFKVNYLAGDKGQTAQAPAVTLKVQGTMPQDLPGSLGPVLPPFEPKYLIWALSAFWVLGLPLAFGLAQRRKGTAPKRLSPAQSALNRLTALQEQLDQGELKGFHVGLSEILKDYLSEAFNKPIKGQTTEEFLAAARSFAELSAEEKKALGAYFQLADQVKFAQYDPGRTLSAEALNEARRLIEQGAP